MTGRLAKLGAQDAPATEPGDLPVAPGHVAAVVPLGFFGVTKAIRASRTLTSTERHVLHLIALCIDHSTGTAAVGVPRLAEDSDYTERTIERTIAVLLAPRAGFEPSAWLWKAPGLSEWGTNLYRITPIAGDVRPPRKRGKGTPTHGRGTSDHPRHSVGGSGVTPDPGSVAPPIEDRDPPRSSIGHSLSSSAGSSADHERESAPPLDLVTGEEAEIVRLLHAHPELRRIARAEVARSIAEEGRSMAVVTTALDELARDARTAAAVGDPIGAATLAKKARTYVQSGREKGGSEGATSAAEKENLEPVEPARLKEDAAKLRALMQAVGAPTAAVAAPVGPTWTPPALRKRT